MRTAPAIIFCLLFICAGCAGPRHVSLSRAQRLQGGTRRVAQQRPTIEIQTASHTVDMSPPEPWSGESEAIRLPAPVEGTPLTRIDLESLAFRNNPTLSAATARMQSARGRHFQAGRRPNPVIGYRAAEVGNRGTAGMQGAFVAQRIITGNKLGLDQAIAQAEYDEAHFLFHAQEQRVLSDVRIRFYDALVAQRRVALTRQLAQIGDDLVKTVRTLEQSRLGTENDLLQAEIRAEESQILFENAQNENVEAWQRLMAVVGVPAMAVTPLAGGLGENLPEFDWESCSSQTLTGNPELLAARARAERARIAISRARREPIPNVELVGAVMHHNVTTSDIASFQAGFPLPVFDKNRGNIRSAEAEWVAARQEVGRIELDLLDRLAVAYRRYANSRNQVNRYSQRIIPRARRSLDLVTRGYEQGQVEYLNLLTAQQTYVEANLSYLDALKNYRASSSFIEGRLLSGSLRTPSEFGN